MRETDSRTNQGYSEHASELGDELKREASQAKEEVRDAAREQAQGLLDRQKAAAAEQAEKVSTVLHKMADEFEEQHQPYFSDCLHELAHRSDQVSRTLRERDLQSLVEQTRDYGRRHPALFLGGAVAAGFMLSRFLRSSAEHGPHSSGRSSQASPMAASTNGPH